MNIKSVFSTLAFLPVLAFGHGGNEDLVHACVKNADGLTRIVSSTAVCTNKETAKHWNIQGLQGLPGVKGDKGDPGIDGSSGPVCDATLIQPGINSVGCDFQHAHLNSRDLRGANFTGANLAGVGLNGSDFTGANFTRANFTDGGGMIAYLNGSDFTGANFTGVNLASLYLNGSDFTGANFTGSNLTNVYLGGAILNNTNFTGVNLTGAYGADAIASPDAKTTIYNHTTCPDGSNSDSNGGTCVGFGM